MDDRAAAIGVFVSGLGLGWWIARRARRLPAFLRPPAYPGFDFLALMSHELKTPINIITGYLELLEDEVPDPLPATARAHVHHARLAAVRMADLVNNLLTWMRLESGGQRVHRERVEAADIVRDASTLLAEQAEARGIRFETVVPPHLSVRTDPSRAGQALRALVANGLKFTEAGIVRLLVEPDGHRVRFHVRDTGVGIAPEHLERIFEPYWQVDGGERRTRGGAGIGLSVARGLARLLGGDVSVESVPGDGSEFVLDLPGG